MQSKNHTSDHFTNSLIDFYVQSIIVIFYNMQYPPKIIFYNTHIYNLIPCKVTKCSLKQPDMY